MQHRKFVTLTLLILLLMSVAPLAAQDDAPEGFPVTVTDGLDRELIFEEPPQRVVAIYNGNFGNLATIGVRPVATLANPSMLANPDYFEDGESIPSVGAADGGIDLEAVAAAEPDLILGWGMEQVQSMSDIAPVYSPLDTDTLEGLYAETRNLGKILGVEERAEEAISNFQDRLTAYQTLVPRDVSILLPAPEEDNLNSMWIRHGASPDCRLLNEIAICDWENPTGDGGWSFQGTPETLLELNPDFIYYKSPWDGTQEELMAYVQENPLWSELDAVQNNRLLYVEGYPNPIASSLIASTNLLDTFAPLLYPEIFPDGPLTAEQVQEILAEQESETTSEANAEMSADGFPRTITDGAGRELTFEEPPERIVTYYNDSFGMLANLGVMPVAQSVNPEMLSDPIYFGEAGESIPTISYDDGPDLEEVAAAEPDLVLVISEEEAQSLEGIAPAFVTPDASNLEELYAAVRLYGDLLGREAEANNVIGNFQDRLTAYQAITSGDFSVLKLGVMDENSFWISTLDDPLCQVMNTIVQCPWETPIDTEYWGYEGTAEVVLSLNPDVIILNNWTNNDYETVSGQLEENPLWGELTAVQNERVLSTPGYDNPIASSLPALQKFLDVYMPLLFPDVLDGPLTDEQVQEILAGTN